MRALVYLEIDAPSSIDELLGPGVDSGAVEKYALLTIDGAPVVYDRQSDSAYEYLNPLAVRCGGLTES